MSLSNEARLEAEIDILRHEVRLLRGKVIELQRLLVEQNMGLVNTKDVQRE